MSSTKPSGIGARGRGRGRGLRHFNVKDYAIGPRGLVYQPEEPESNPQKPSATPAAKEVSTIPIVSSHRNAAVFGCREETVEELEDTLTDARDLSQKTASASRQASYDTRRYAIPSLKNRYSYPGLPRTILKERSEKSVKERVEELRAQVEAVGRGSPVTIVEGLDTPIIPGMRFLSSDQQEGSQTFRLGLNSPSLTRVITPEHNQLLYIHPEVPKPKQVFPPRPYDASRTQFLFHRPPEVDWPPAAGADRLVEEEMEDLDFWGNPRKPVDPDVRRQNYENSLTALPRLPSSDLEYAEPSWKKDFKGQSGNKPQPDQNPKPNPRDKRPRRQRK